MISLNTINQINDIITILNNTRKVTSKPQSNDSDFIQKLQQNVIQTPAQTVQQATVLPSIKYYSNMYNDTCCVKGCNKPAVLWVKNMPYCKEHDPANRINTEED